MCASKWKTDLLPMAFFLGNAATVMFVPRYSDKTGRKRIYWVGLIIDIGLYFCFFVARSLTFMYIVLFSFGATSVARTQIGWVYLMELTPKRDQVLIGTCWGVISAMIFIFSTVYFWVLSKNWMFLAAIGFVLHIFAAVSCYFLPESPHILGQLNRLEKCRESLSIIARINKTPLTFNKNAFNQDARRIIKQAVSMYVLQIENLPADTNLVQVQHFLNQNMTIGVEPTVKLISKLEPGKYPTCHCEVKFTKEREMIRAHKKLQSVDKFNG